MKPVLEEKVRELELDNVHILPYQPRSLMPSILAYSDIQFIFMNPEMEMQGFPSKVYTIMACGRPYAQRLQEQAGQELRCHSRL